MKLLITTQAVDLDDPILGFFHRWIEEFARQCETVQVICLKEGRHALPSNVSVHSLGKEFGVSRVTYILRFYRYVWTLRHEYDAVFAHMNPEYIILAGPLWRVLGKKIGLWYTHKAVHWRLRAGEALSHVVCTASQESFRLPSKKAHVMGHGIDTDFFSPDQRVARGEHILSVGRLMKVKRHDLAIRLAKERGVPIHIIGDGPERASLESLAQELGVQASFLGGLTQEKLRDEYRRAALLVHRSETGSLDKVVLEAAACGCPVDTTDPALAALPLSPEYVRTHHSLPHLVSRILALLV